MPAEAILGILAILAVAGAGYLLRPSRLRRLAREKARKAVAAAAPLAEVTGRDYLRASQVQEWLDRHRGYKRLSLTRRARRRLTPDPELKAAHDLVAGLFDRPWRWTAERNEAHVAARLDELDDWFTTRFPHPLTYEQRRAVVTDEDCNLVVAGAGSGKTAAILGKLAYLMEHRGVPPSDILVLAFNTTVAAELRERIESLGMPMPEVSTFHAKGYEILGAARGRKPAVSALSADRTALQRFLAERFAARMRERAYRKRFSKWWVERRVEASELKKSETPDERLRKEQALGLRTLIGVQVQSQSEVKVGDWLTLRGIRWEHEPRYPHTPASTERRDYTPDFYLPDYDLWIEVWACGRREERFPPEIDKARYKEAMQWKRELHEASGTQLMELFQNDIWGGRLGDRLTGLLEEAQVRTEDPSGDALESLLASVEDSFPPFVGLVSSFLELFRSGGWTRAQVQKRATSRRARGFLELFWPLLDDYEEALRLEGKIDFSEMLLGASEAIDQGFEPRPYRYILVDEFQDVSRARLELIRHLRDGAHGRLFLVGDDWQSIYRFAGSDLSYFTAAPDYLGATARTDLGKTFRLAPDVAALSTRFITRNPAQLEKEIVPRDVDLERPAVVIRLYDGTQAAAVQEVLEEIGRTEAGQVSVLVLGRYNHTLRVLDELPRPVPESVALQPLTVHRAKGLEADHVIVLGLENGRYGFPSEIEDDAVLRLLIANQETFPNAEERRLFYVALTRTRERVYLVAPARDTSAFVQEVMEGAYAAWTESDLARSERYRCPRCRGRTIRRIEGPAGSFWGCSNYPACHGRLPTCFECEVGVLEGRSGEGGVLLAYACGRCWQEAEVCPECGVGALVPRNGPRGGFLGCSEWRWDGRGCGYTRGVAAPVDSS